MLAVTLELGTTTTQITTTTIGALGLCFARSLSTVTTHTVSIGRLAGTTLHDTVRLKAGEAAVLRLAPGDYAARAAVAGTRAVLTIYED
jgi:ABC-type sugar transport system substrate-binding protein